MVPDCKDQTQAKGGRVHKPSKETAVNSTHWRVCRPSTMLPSNHMFCPTANASMYSTLEITNVLFECHEPLIR